MVNVAPHTYLTSKHEVRWRKWFICYVYHITHRPTRFICQCVCVHACVFVCVHVCVFVHVHVCVFVCMCVWCVIVVLTY